MFVNFKSVNLNLSNNLLILLSESFGSINGKIINLKHYQKVLNILKYYIIVNLTNNNIRYIDDIKDYCYRKHGLTIIDNNSV